MFYGIIQDGNDLWNATFFCGSCAILRRDALDDVGGVATETVTEDAHTALRMQERSWNTAYINIPQAAGLATGTLSAHVGQRIRWARGMIQIMRTEKFLFNFKMTITQRLCYVNAMLHFMYAVPRLIFLMAPLAYMLFRWTILPGYWLAILAYAMPHLIISSLTNSRLLGNYRHSFWNEIYETVLAPYILFPTFLALINPKLGKFNVTKKDSTLEETSFDRHIATPTIVLLALNTVGLCAVPYRLLVTDPTHSGTVLSNMAWILFNMVILGVAAAVANEQQQRRTTVRIPAVLPVHLRGDDGFALSGVTSDISVGGASLSLSEGTILASGLHLHISFPLQTGNLEIGATALGQFGQHFRLKFDVLTMAEQETITRVIFSRSGAWVSTTPLEVDHPLVSLARIVRLSFTGFHQVLLGLVTRKAASPTHLLVLLFLIPILHGLRNAKAETSRTAPIRLSATPRRHPPTPIPVTLLSDANTSDRITLADMGVKNAIQFLAGHSYYSAGFVLSHGRVPRAGRIDLTYHFSASSLVPNTGSIAVSINGTAIGRIAAPAVPQIEGEYGFVSMSIPPESLVRNNELRFELTGTPRVQQDRKAKSDAFANIGSSSTVFISGESLPLANDLSSLPLPLFDSELQTTTTIPFVFLSAPTPMMLESASVVASWLGVQVGMKPMKFSVAIGSIPRGNVIIFANRIADLPRPLGIPTGIASVNIRTNPTGNDGAALILAGDDDGQVLSAARSLSLTAVQQTVLGEKPRLLGNSVKVGAFTMPAARRPDDAPRWMSTDSPAPLWMDASRLTVGTDGSKPIPLYLRLSPDLYYGENLNLNLRLVYRFTTIEPDAALRVYVNGTLVNEAPLFEDNDSREHERRILLPAANMRPFSNTLAYSQESTTRRDPEHIANRSSEVGTLDNHAQS